MSTPSDRELLTDWFPADVAPVRAGVYEKDFNTTSNVRDYQYWDGRRWYYGTNTPEETAADYESGDRTWTHPHPRPWRGLAHNPDCPQ